MNAKRKATSAAATSTQKPKKQKRQSDLAAGFAAQILKSPRKIHHRTNLDQASVKTLEIDDAIEISSDEERPANFRTNKVKHGPHEASRQQRLLGLKVEAHDPDLPLVSADVTTSRQRDRGTQTQTQTETAVREEVSWLDRIPLRKLSDLAVHKKKVADVQAWIEGSFKNVSQHTILVLTGPAGVGKTATVETLAHVLDFDILEWKNPMSDEWSEDVYDREADSLAQKFERFLSISDKYSALDFGQGTHADPGNRRKVIVVEDIPNTFSSSSSSSTPSSAKLAFRNSIRRYLNSPRNKYPLILVITETEPRGEDGDWRLRSDAMSVRNLMSRDIVESRNCAQITFNDVAPTFIVKALARIVDSLPRREAVDISQAVLEEIAQTSNGDIRSAINSLQFVSHRFSTHGAPPRPRRRKKRGEVLTLTGDERAMLDIITNRESALGYFHAVGKVLYNKRVPSSLDPIAYDDLPAHLAHEARERPETSASAILDETSTDVGSFLAGIHQNYTASVTRVQEAHDLVEGLSFCDGASLGNGGGGGGGGRYAGGGQDGGVLRLWGTVAVMAASHAIPANAKRDSTFSNSSGGGGRGGGRGGGPSTSTFRTPHPFGGTGAKIYFPPFVALNRRHDRVRDALTLYLSSTATATAIASVDDDDDAMSIEVRGGGLLDRISYHAMILKNTRSSVILNTTSSSSTTTTTTTTSRVGGGGEESWFAAVTFDRFSTLGRGGKDAHATLPDDDDDDDDDGGHDNGEKDKRMTDRHGDGRRDGSRQGGKRQASSAHDLFQEGVEDDEIEEVE